MRRLILVVAACTLGPAIASMPATGHAAQLSPQVDSRLLDDAGNPIGGALGSGANVHVHATVSGTGAAPTGSVAFLHFATADCSGASTAGSNVALVTSTQPAFKTADVSNGAGWDSATAWNSNGIDHVGTNWFGGLFAGNDAGFGSSSMAWRFTGAPLRAGDTVTAAHLSLRIRKSRPNLESEEASTWKTVLAVDTRDGAGFEGETRAAFLARLNTWGATWEMPVSSDVPDPFGTNDGAGYAASPDVTPLVQSRIGDVSWVAGEGIVIGVLNHGTPGIAEAEVVDEPDYARLHIEWTTTEDVHSSDSGALTPDVGVQSYQAHYGGDAVYSVADGPCMSLTVSPPAPSVGGIAEQPDVSALPASAPPDGRGEAWALAGVVAMMAAAAVIAGWAARRRG